MRCKVGLSGRLAELQQMSFWIFYKGGPEWIVRTCCEFFYQTAARLLRPRNERVGVLQRRDMLQWWADYLDGLKAAEEEK